MMIDKERLKDQLQNAAERRTNPLKKERYVTSIPKVKRKKSPKILEKYPYQKWLSAKERKT